MGNNNNADIETSAFENGSRGWNPKRDPYLELVRPIVVQVWDDVEKKRVPVHLSTGTRLQPYMVDAHPRNETERRAPVLALFAGMVIRLGRGVTQYHGRKAAL